MTFNKKKIRRYLQELRYILPTLYFNFHYLPFRQAIRLPIVLYKPHLVKCKGKIRLEPEDGRIRHGMVRMGFRIVSLYPNNGITWEDKGATIVFRGSCVIGNDSYVSLGTKTKVDFGHSFAARAGLKLVSYRGMTFAPYSCFGWECLLMDTNFHTLCDMNTGERLPGGGPITIGDHNWFGSQCRVMHSVNTPPQCIFAMGTTVTHGSQMKSYCIMGGSPVRVLREHVMRDYEHDSEIIE